MNDKLRKLVPKNPIYKTKLQPKTCNQKGNDIFDRFQPQYGQTMKTVLREQCDLKNVPIQFISLREPLRNWFMSKNAQRKSNKTDLIADNFRSIS